LEREKREPYLSKELFNSLGVKRRCFTFPSKKERKGGEITFCLEGHSLGVPRKVEDLFVLSRKKKRKGEGHLDRTHRALVSSCRRKERKF